MIDTEREGLAKIPKWRYEQIERAVVKLYKEQRVHKFPVDPFEIIASKGYVLIPFSRLSFNAFISVMDGKNEAFSFFSPEIKNYVIIYDDDKSLQRIRFTLMHEIGHIVLGHRCESDLARKEADYFAGYALAPSPAIAEYTNSEVQEIVSKFWVSPECAEICKLRCSNWLRYGGAYLRDYERDLLGIIRE